MAGFVTNRPDLWVEAFLLCTEEYDKESRHEYVKNEEGTAWSEFIILIKFMDTKQITFSVKMTTGYVTIKGPDFQKWIETEFKFVKFHVHPVEKNIIEDETSTEESYGSKCDENVPAKTGGTTADGLELIWRKTRN